MTLIADNTPVNASTLNTILALPARPFALPLGTVALFGITRCRGDVMFVHTGAADTEAAANKERNKNTQRMVDEVVGVSVYGVYNCAILCLLPLKFLWW